MGPEVTIHNPFHLGFKLFERNHQSVELTEPGRRFVEEAQEAVMHMDALSPLPTQHFVALRRP
jgi:DNA-binding transcriptional LysR family regulator